LTCHRRAVDFQIRIGKKSDAQILLSHQWLIVSHQGTIVGSPRLLGLARRLLFVD
jgi:hypothetical protein